MENSQIIEIVNKIFEEEFELESAKIIPEAKLYEDLGLDSLDGVDLIVSLEKSFHFKAKEEEARAVRTVGDIYEYIFKQRDVVKAGNGYEKINS